MNLPRSSYYYRSKPLSAQEKRVEADLRDRIERISCDFPRYGYRRITKQLKRDGIIVNHKKVLRIMREESLLCEIKRAWVTTTDSRHSFRRFPNLIKNVAVTGPNQIWASDITYIRIASGFVYLAVILDTYSRKVIGYAISKSLDTALTLYALNAAISQRKPPPGCIHHSDQGVQYASEAYTAVLNTHKFHISMSGKGNPYDNAMAESFFKTLKQEEVYLWDYETFEDVIQRIPYFIEQVYNQKRLHSSLDYVPPDEFEQAFYENHNRESCRHITN